MSNVIKVAEQVKSSCTGCYYRSNPRACSHPDGMQGSECNSTRTIYVQAPTSRANDPTTGKGKRKVNKYEQAVLDILKCEPHGPLNLGLTGKEMAIYTDHPLNCITPRFAPLRRKGLIKALTKFNDGATCGEEQATIEVVKRDKQIVWVLA